ncbi:I78 family peptidase inhibitor [Pseudoxanthomonas sp. JBR18]|uniref:I78 family peptidase inhibitor n=1 Tax=Pseudoxanthomonas sp. JBR18 TaxID=2969308 RepID=UPI002305D352|nr:I78 family peptidase inhibitor [Pseudoxanthomonas sp. JBR18]WCE05938.1 I78 family peptidase inhibitor [Pseudoxanthomonas sp. JBR18]
MFRITLPMSLLVLGLSACSGPQPDEQQRAVAQSEQRAEAAATATGEQAPPADASACDATQAQWLVGKTPTQADLDQAKQDTGAESVRVLKPNQVVTMEFNAARLNVEVDDKGAASAVRCG